MKKNREEKDPDQWYTAMYEYDYGGDATITHATPTMRLIGQKNASVSHKTVFKDGVEM